MPIDQMVVMALKALVNVLFQPLNNCWTTYIAANDAFFFSVGKLVPNGWAIGPGTLQFHCGTLPRFGQTCCPLLTELQATYI